MLKTFEQFLTEGREPPMPAGHKKVEFSSFKEFKKVADKLGHRISTIGRNPNRFHITRGASEDTFRAGAQLGHFEPKWRGGSQSKDEGAGWLYIKEDLEDLKDKDDKKPESDKDDEGKDSKKDDKEPESDKDEELEEAISVDHSAFQRAHGKKPSGSGNWYVGVGTHNVDVVKGKEGEHYVQHNGKLSDALKKAKEAAKKHGKSSVHTLS